MPPLKTSLLLSVCLGSVCFLSPSPVRAQTTNAPLPRYEFRTNHDPNGTGKFYLGREIAQVMGHEGADWLERPDREKQERPDLLLKALDIKPGQALADIGAGTGFYTRRLARQTGPKGTVYAVDIQPEMLQLLTNKLSAEGLNNVRPVLGEVADPRLPAGALDLILMVDVYHEFEQPFEMAERLCAALKPGGRLVFVEFRGEDPAVPIKRVHKMTETQVRKEMSVQPLTWVETVETLPWQHVIVFRR